MASSLVDHLVWYVKLIIQAFFSPLWKHDPTPRTGIFSCHFMQNWEKLSLYNLINLNKESNIWFTNKHISNFGMQKYNLLWHSAVKLPKNGDHFFLFLELGIFSLKLGKNILFVIGNMTQYRSPK